MERKRMLVLPSEIKAVGDSAGGFVLEGILSTSALDRDNEIVEPTAFTNLAEFSTVPLPLYYEHNRNQHIGHALSVEPMKTKIKVQSSLADTALVRDTVRPLVENGSLKAYSVGFVGVDGKPDAKGVWVWRTAHLREHSLVSMPANVQAIAALAKSLGYEYGPMLTKGVVQVDHPIHEDAEVRWDAAGADKRVRTWAGAAEGPNEKYRGCFLWYDDSAPDLFASYKLQVCDVYDGKPEVVFRALAAVMGRMNQTEIPAADKAKVARVCTGYYEKFGKPLPGKSDEANLEHKRILEVNLFGERLGRLCGNAKGLADILVAWQRAGVTVADLKALGEEDLGHLDEAYQSVAAVLREFGSEPGGARQGVSETALDPWAQMLALVR